MNAHRNMRSKLPWLVISLCVFTVIGWSAKTVIARPILMTEYQPDRASIIVVGEFQSQKLSEEQREKLSRELIKVLKEQNAFAQVLHKISLKDVQVLHEVSLKEKNEHIVFLDGEIGEYEERSKFAQLVMGFSPGASGLRTTFILFTPEGQRLVAFRSQRTYEEGIKNNGASLGSRRDLVEDMGREIALAVSKWKRGEPWMEKGSERGHPSEAPFDAPGLEQHFTGDDDE